jgi:GT2 family glycosyltransferase
MITVIYSTHKDQDYNKKFKDHLEKSIGIKEYQILEYQNNNEFSLSHIYNKGIVDSIYDIVVCCHNDIKLETGWGRKLLKNFTDNPDYGIIGKAGSCYFPESGIYWERINETMVGQVYHHPDGHPKFLSRYSTKLPYLIPVVTIDGLFISFDKTKIKHTFDESIGKFHFYDHLFCVPNFLDGVKIGVTTSFDITHQSVGMPNEEFFKTKDKFVEKYGKVLPLDIKPEEVYVEHINYGAFRNFGRIAIIIPTKGNVNLLIDCVNSFIEHCNIEIFEIFIADTGSINEEKELIRIYIENNKEKVPIHLIEYDYYNFAQINNDVVKNHVGSNFKFLLFCNNDIIILNDVIGGMLNVFKSNANAGTVGCRLHYEDNTIQHNGIVSTFQKETKQVEPSHLGSGSYYRYVSNLNVVGGNTGALMMIRKNVFEKCGYFNENYLSCFEDVELSYKCILNNLENYCDGRSVAYHLESRTRNGDPKMLEMATYDYEHHLKPFIDSNFNKLRKYIVGA